jgi:hypothetical protein
MKMDKEKFWKDIKICDTATVHLVEITPELAQEWLKNQVQNRKPDKRSVQVVAEAINLNLWRANHQVFAFNDEFEAFDCQHRCNAIIQTGKTIKGWVWTEAPYDDEIMQTIDKHRGRSTADILTIQGSDIGAKSKAGTIARAMLLFSRPSVNIPDKSTLANVAVKKFEDNILFVLSLEKKYRANVLNNTELSVLARAHHCGVSEKDLEAFYQALSTSNAVDGYDCSAAAAFTKCKNRGSWKGKTYFEKVNGKRKKISKRALPVYFLENALDHFLRRQSLSVIKYRDIDKYNRWSVSITAKDAMHAIRGG